MRPSGKLVPPCHERDHLQCFNSQLRPRMNTSLRSFIACAIGLFPSLGAFAQDQQIKPPSFLKVGHRYRFSFATGGERPWNFGKIVEFGPGPWMRVQLLVPDEPGKRISSAATTPAPGSVL